jgi:hypothetical protein
MSLLLIVVLYATAVLLLAQVRALEMTPGVETLVSIAGSLSALVLPIIIYALIDRRFTQAAVDTVARQWCVANDKEFERAEIFKTHVALSYRDGPSKARRKFRVRFQWLSWKVREVEWLDH